MKIYVAGKITGLSRREVEGKFRATAETLKNEGHDVFIDAVYMLSDWRQSKGARMELQYAADWRKEILYEDESTREPNFPVVRTPR